MKRPIQRNRSLAIAASRPAAPGLWFYLLAGSALLAFWFTASLALR
jgi:hypothetical protein